MGGEWAMRVRTGEGRWVGRGHEESWLNSGWLKSVWLKLFGVRRVVKGTEVEPTVPFEICQGCLPPAVVVVVSLVLTLVRELRAMPVHAF